MKNLIICLCCCCFYTANAQKGSCLSLSLLSPIVYGESSIGYHFFSKKHFSFGGAIGYMQRVSKNDYSLMERESQVSKGRKGIFTAFSTRYYVFELSKDKALNLFGGINLVGSYAVTQYVNFGETTEKLLGINIGCGLRHKLNSSLAMEYGFTIPAISSGAPEYISRINPNYPGLGQVSTDQQKSFSPRRPCVSVNLQIAL